MCAFRARSAGNCSNKESGFGCANCKESVLIGSNVFCRTADQTGCSFHVLTAVLKSFFLDYDYCNNGLVANTVAESKKIVTFLALNLLLMQALMKHILSVSQWQRSVRLLYSGTTHLSLEQLPLAAQPLDLQDLSADFKQTACPGGHFLSWRCAPEPSRKKANSSLAWW